MRVADHADARVLRAAAGSAGALGQCATTRASGRARMAPSGMTARAVAVAGSRVWTVSGNGVSRAAAAAVQAPAPRDRDRSGG